ncbi:GNAT family N-acetyltransferase [Nanoarchaeota archaeon]
MEIRKANIKDIPAIAKLFVEYEKKIDNVSSTKAWRPSPTKKQAAVDIRSYVVKKDKVIFVAIENNKIIGYLFGKFTRMPSFYEIRDMGSLDDIYVLPKWQGKRISTQLRDKFIEWFNKKIKHKAALSLYVAPGNKGAIKIYEKWGFKTAYLNMIKELKNKPKKKSKQS